MLKFLLGKVTNTRVQKAPMKLKKSGEQEIGICDVAWNVFLYF